MDKNLHNGDFEQFVKQNADQYRMFPSEQVWKNIHHNLHSRRRWVGIGLLLLMITTATVTLVMTLPSGKDASQTPRSLLARSVAFFNSSSKDNNNTLKALPASESSFVLVPVAGLQQNKFASQPGNPLGSPSIAAFTPPSAEESLKVTDLNLASVPAATRKIKPLATANPVSLSKADAGQLISDEGPAEQVEEKKTAKAENFEKLPEIKSRSAASINRKSSSRINWQLYFTPTISYRSLTENAAYTSAARYNNIVNGGNPAIYTTDVNGMVNHKPHWGFQLGLRGALPLSSWLSITSGVQLGVSKYDIRAYQHSPEIATISLIDRNVSTISSYRNTGGYKENWLRNFYFTAAIPVGIDMKLSDGSRNYFGVAGTVQPSFVIDNRAYLISSDYKNYAEMPSLTRRFNLNTSFEIYTAFTTGKMKWRAGPQVRYQTMSSFLKNYPIKEHLFDFGLKMGIQLK